MLTSYFCFLVRYCLSYLNCGVQFDYSWPYIFIHIILIVYVSYVIQNTITSIGLSNCILYKYTSFWYVVCISKWKFPCRIDMRCMLVYLITMSSFILSFLIPGNCVSSSLYGRIIYDPCIDLLNMIYVFKTFSIQTKSCVYVLWICHHIGCWYYIPVCIAMK